MPLFLPLAAALLLWSVVANLVFGDTLYLARNLALTVVLLVVARRAGLTWQSMGLDSRRTPAGLRWGAVAVAVVAVVVAAGVLLSERVGPVGALLSDERADLSVGELAYHSLLRIPFGTAVFEEVAFRGVVLGALLRRCSPAVSVAWSSVLFGIWHVAPAIVALDMNQVAAGSVEGLLATLGAVLVTTVAGVLFCLLRLRSGSLLAPVLAHWATNSLGLLAAVSAGS